MSHVGKDIWRRQGNVVLGISVPTLWVNLVVAPRDSSQDECRNDTDHVLPACELQNGGGTDSPFLILRSLDESRYARS